MIVNSQLDTRQFRYVDKCWTSNGEQPLTSLALSPGTHALSYASSVFEGIRFYNNKPFAVDEHLARLSQSARIIGVADNLQTNAIKKSVYAAARFFPESDGYIRPIVWIGDETYQIQAADLNFQWCVLLSLAPSSLTMSNVPSKRLWVSTIRKAKWPYVFDNVKCSGNYTISAYALKEANSNNCDDALMLDSDGYICESSGANIIIRFGKELISPFVGPALDGITVRYMESLAQNIGYSFERNNVSLDDLETADEVIMCGTSHEVVSINEVRDLNVTLNFRSRSAATLIRDEFRKMIYEY